MARRGWPPRSSRMAFRQGKKTINPFRSTLGLLLLLLFGGTIIYQVWNGKSVIDGASPSSSFFTAPLLLDGEVLPGEAVSQSSTTTTDKLSSSLICHDQSYGFFTDIPNPTWQKMRLDAQAQRMDSPTAIRKRHQVRGRPTTTALWYANHVPHPQFSCPAMERVGGHGEGAKWVCDPVRLAEEHPYDKNNKDCLVYSIGSAGDYKFEIGLAQLLNKACEIHVFDPGPFARPEYETQYNITYHSWGLTPSTTTTTANGGDHYVPAFQPNVNVSQVQTFVETVQALGHQGRRLDILKLDCERCEWYTYRDWLGLSNTTTTTTRHSSLMDIRQVLMETHGRPPQSSQQLQPPDLFSALQQQGYAMFAKEANLFIGGTCVEFGFLKLHPDFWDHQNNNTT